MFDGKTGWFPRVMCQFLHHRVWPKIRRRRATASTSPASQEWEEVTQMKRFGIALLLALAVLGVGLNMASADPVDGGTSPDSLQTP